MSKIIKSLLIIPSLLSLASCNNKQPEKESESHRDENQPLLYLDFEEVDANKNYYDVISGDAFYTKGSPELLEEKDNKALRFDGESSLELNTFAGIEGNNPFTLSAKVKLDIDLFVDATLDYTIIATGSLEEFGNAKIGIHYNKYSMYYVNKYGYINFQEDNKTTWHTLSLGYDGYMFHFYLDGSEKQTLRIKDGMKMKKTSLYVGGYMANGEGFIGDIDDVMVFDRFLEGSEIKKYMNHEVDFKKNEPNNNVPTSEDGEIYSNIAKALKPGQWFETSAVIHKVQLNFTIYLPKNYDSKKQYPALLFLVGDGGVGWKPSNILTGGECVVANRTIDEYPDTICIVPSPTVSWIRILNDQAASGKHGVWTLDNATPSNYLLAAIDLVKGLSEPLNIDMHKLYFHGVSRGCMAGWYLFNKYPDMFAGAVMVEGSGTIEEDAIKNIAKTPTWLFISKDDQLIDYGDFMKVYDALVAAKADTRITVAEGLNHFETNVVVDNETGLLDWLYSNINSRLS